MASPSVYGVLRPAIDAHTLGTSAFSDLLEDAGFKVVTAESDVCDALVHLESTVLLDRVVGWLVENRVTHVGFSYRLDPDDGVRYFNDLFFHLKGLNMLVEDGGLIRRLLFAGLPAACRRIRSEHGSRVLVFFGDETPADTLRALKIPRERWPASLARDAAYDNALMGFGRSIIASDAPASVSTVERGTYAGFATPRDSLGLRVAEGTARGLPPLLRAHVGPYDQDRDGAVRQFIDWTRELASRGLLDVLSIGSSQLTQSHFGQDWTGLPNGGGVPLKTEQEFRAVYDAAHPMLVRAYAGTSDVPAMARMLERTIDIAWHALSFWWFCRLDGRGPLPLRENLQQHVETLRFIASTGKPFEPNIPHHFAFRGSDDVTYVVSAYLAALTAKRLGVRHLVLQNMLNTPKATWGVQDLAKARAMLRFIRSLEDESFRVYYQPRAGLDFFSHDLDKARAQLAAVTAMMDDVEPWNPRSPEIIHVVSYSEGAYLADPPTIDESLRITRSALEAYRKARGAGDVPDMANDPDVDDRTVHLVNEVKTVLRHAESAIPNLYSPEGLLLAFWAGFLPTPSLWGDRQLFPHATRWRTRMLNGSSRVVDDAGNPISAEVRGATCAAAALHGVLPMTVSQLRKTGRLP
jgi:hypothetical protein